MVTEMRNVLRSVSFSVIVAGSAASAAAETYPFVGTWDCSVAIFSFTAEIYNNGSENLVITDIAADGDGYVLTMEDDYQLSITVTDNGQLNWYSPVSGDSFTCTPVK